MTKKSWQLGLYVILTIILTLGLSISLQSLLAVWVPPADTPPNQNAPAPVNIGTAKQTKAGDIDLDDLGVAGNLDVVGDIITDGNVGIGEAVPGQALDVNGNVEADAYYYSSDERLKTDIQPIPSALKKILELSGTKFYWQDSGAADIGVTAQDVEAVFPELVNTNEQTGLKSVKYGNLVAPLIEAIRELEQQIEGLEEQIKELQAR